MGLRKIITHTHSRTFSVNALGHYAIAAALSWCGQEALTT